MATAEEFEYTCTLSEDTLTLARTELHEDPKTRMLELKAFRDRLLNYPGLVPRTDPQFLIRFLRARKFDQERAFELMLNYYRLRKENEALFTGLKPSGLSHVYQSAIGFPHKYRDRQGRKIFFYFPGTHVWICRAHKRGIFGADYMSLSKMIENEEDQVRGFTLITDFEDYSFAEFLKRPWDPEASKRIIRLWVDAFPARVKVSLIVNQPTFMDVITAITNQFLKDKFIQRTKLLGRDWGKLHQWVDPAFLPSHYGGTLPGTLDNKEWVESLMQSDAQLEAESKYGFVDYTIGPDSAHRLQQDAISTMAGTFRKIHV